MSVPNAKLTKKQKKGLAFRERGSKGSKKNAKAPEVDEDGVPIQENQDLLEMEEQMYDEKPQDMKDTKRLEQNRKGKARAKVVTNFTEKGGADIQDRTAKRPIKRKLAEVDGADDDVVTKKKKKKSGSAEGGGDSEETGGQTKHGEKAGEKARYILFVGNLKFTTTQEAVRQHFSKCDPPPTVRLLTPKVDPSKAKPTTKSKGCAFVEFSHRNALQQGLKLHQSELEGRRINVELTAGGGGKGEKRLSKVRERNKDLDGQRKKRVEKQGTTSDILVVTERPQRHSTTSGLEQVLPSQRTWTVGDDNGDDKGKRRGSRKGIKHRATKEWSTGVNSIPLG